MSDLVSELAERARALDPAAAELAAAWEAEIERRLAEHYRGEVSAVDAETVFAKARHLAQ